METTDFFANAPTKIKVGRVLVLIGSILFFVVAVGRLVDFALAFIPYEGNEMDWNDAYSVFEVIAHPFLAVFFVVAGIGGICYAIDKHRIKVFASLAGVIMLVVIVIATVLMFRNLIKSCLAPNADVGRAWFDFATDFIGIQLSGGIYFVGWFMTKDYTGD